MNELVSVVIPTYKGTRKIARAIDSVLNSTYKNVEIIVVDDNEPKSIERFNTERIMEKYRQENVKYIKHDQNKNGSAARNTGINNAKGYYIAFLDDDDYYTTDRIQKAVDSLKRKKKNTFFSAVGVVRSGMNCSVTYIPQEITAKQILLNDKIIGTGSNLFLETKVVKELGGFDETFVRYQDREFLMRLCKVGKIYVTDEILVIKSKNGQNNVPNIYKMKKTEEKFLEKFQMDYNELSVEDKQNYLNRVNHVLFELALEAKDKEEIEKSYIALKDSKSLYCYEKLAFLLERCSFIDEKKIKRVFVYIVYKVRNLVTAKTIKKNKGLWQYVKSMERIN